MRAIGGVGPGRGKVREIRGVPRLSRLPWLTEAVRKSVSEAALDDDSAVKSRGSRKSQTCQDLSYGVSAPPTPAPAPAPQGSPPSFFLSGEQLEAEAPGDERLQYPDGFEPLRSDQPAAIITVEASPVVKNPFMSPLLAPDSMLRGLPPVHIVVRARAGESAGRGALSI